MSDKATIAALQRTVAQQEAELLRLRAELASELRQHESTALTAMQHQSEAHRLRALLASCDERLDELGCGACSVPPRAPVEAVPEAVGEAMVTLRKALAQARRPLVPSLLRVEQDLALVEKAVRATIEACAQHVAGWAGGHLVVRAVDPAPIVARVLGGGE